MEAAYHCGGKRFKLLASSFFVLQGQGTCYQGLGPFPCVVRGLPCPCSPVGQCRIEYFVSLFSLLVWVVFLWLIFSVKLWPFMFSGFVVLLLLRLLGSLSWFFWFSSLLASRPHLVFSATLCFSLDSLPPFYSSLLTAWRMCNGSLTASSLGIGSGIDFCPVASMTTKSAYLFLLSENAVSPHFEGKFFLCLVLFIGLVLGISFSFLIWIVLLLICVGRFLTGSFTRPRGLPVLFMLSLLLLIVLLLWSLFSICFSSVLWRSVSCLGFSLLCFWLLLFVLPWFVTCFLVSRLMSCLQFLRFLFIC